MNEIESAENRSAQSPGGVIRATSATGDLRIHEFSSWIFHKPRFLRVWLPPDYELGGDRRYPIFYLNDGQNLFESSTAFAGTEWQVDETAYRLMRENVVPSMIIVGIDNAGEARLREYMPYRSLRPTRWRAQGSHYPSFLTEEVMPFVARNYRIAAGPENTGLGGSSLGALIALYTALMRPGLISRLLLESPSLWAANRRLIRESRSVKQWPERVFLGCGTAEAGTPAKNQSVVDDVREMAGILRRAGLDEKRLRVVVEDGATHSESAWARRFPGAFAFLWSK